MFLGLLTDVTDGAAYGLMCTTDELYGYNGRATSLPQPKATVNEFATNRQQHRLGLEAPDQMEQRQKK